MRIKTMSCTATTRCGRTGLAVLAALTMTAGCRREEVTHYRVPKPQQSTSLSAAFAAASTGAPAPGAAPAAAPGVAPPPRPTVGPAWNLPRGWTQELAGGMRYATLKPPVQGKIDGSVVVLPGAAGGELANVNRWRGQIGLGPIDEAALAAARRPVKAPVGPVSVYDFGGAQGRMLAALAEVDGSTWFVKLSGDAEPVAAAKSDFLELVGSLRRASSN
jgi:hypothetical protein